MSHRAWPSVCWAKPQLIGPAMCLFPITDFSFSSPRGYAVNSPFVYLLYPIKHEIKGYIKYPNQFDNYWIHSAYKKKTKDLFVINSNYQMHKMNFTESKWKWIQVSCQEARLIYSGLNLFVNNSKVYLFGLVMRSETHSYGWRWTIWELDENTNKFIHKISATKPERFADDSGCGFIQNPITIPSPQTKSSKIRVFIISPHNLSKIRVFDASNGSIQCITLKKIKYNDKDEDAISFDQEIGAISLRDEKIMIYSYNSGKPVWINIIDIKKASIGKAVYIKPELHDPVNMTLWQDTDQEDVIVHGYCRHVYDECNMQLLPHYLIQIVIEYYSNEWLLIIKTTTKITNFQYCFIKIDDLLSQPPKFNDHLITFRQSKASNSMQLLTNDAFVACYPY